VVALNSSTTGTKRPLLVWLITLFSGLAIVLTLASFVLVYSGRVPLNPAEKSYFQGLGIFDHATTALLMVLNTAGVILLFRLRKSAVPLIVGASALNLALTIRAELVTRWAQATGPVHTGAICGVGLALAIAYYAENLRRKRLLM
jgi:hypothetical protein